jgi:nitric oxide synthase oxygenase domain/subunit
MKMKWLEVIGLRSVERNREILESKLQMLTDEVDKGRQKQVIMVYRRELINTDFGIHIYHDSKKVESCGSRLGIRLADALKEFGLVNHSIWIEMHSK